MARWCLQLVCALSSIASADGVTKWDGTYTTEYGGSGPDLCPKKAPTVVVKGGRVSFTWTIPWGNAPISIGTVEGVARDTGFVTTKTTLLDPAKLAPVHDRLADLQKMASALQFAFKDRTLTLEGDGCYVRWETDAAAEPTPSASEPESPGPTKPAKSTTAAKGVKTAKPPTPLAAGSSKWDATYNAYASMINDWRCPPNEALDNLVVKRGRFSIPWRVPSKFGDISLGQLDGSIAANGKVKLRPWVSVIELPPELAATGRTLATLKAFAPKMAFTVTEGSREAKFLLGAEGSACSYEMGSIDTVAKKKSSGSSASKSSGSSASKSSGSSSAKSSGSASKSSGSSGSSSSSSSPSSSSKPKGKGIGNGLACYDNEDCASDHCDFRRCVTESGDKDYAPGAACEWGSDCASGSCNNKKCR